MRVTITAADGTVTDLECEAIEIEVPSTEAVGYTLLEKDIDAAGKTLRTRYRLNRQEAPDWGEWLTGAKA